MAITPQQAAEIDRAAATPDAPWNKNAYRPMTDDEVYNALFTPVTDPPLSVDEQHVYNALFPTN